MSKSQGLDIQTTRETPQSSTKGWCCLRGGKPPSTRENVKSSSGSQTSQQNSKFQARTAQGTRKATVANPDAWGRLIGPQN